MRRKTVIVTAILLSQFILLFTPLLSVRADDLEITGGGDKAGEVDQYISLAGMEILGSSDDPVPVVLTVPKGQLSMTDTTGLTFSTSETGKNLAFTGSIADINNALATLRYRTTFAGTVEFEIVLTDPGLVYYPGNGHFYEVVYEDEGVTFDQARTLAELRTRNGSSGYLATVTSSEENSYITARLENDGWMGASDADTEGDWLWVTGPEAGSLFWRGLSDGTLMNDLFENWSSGEPNDSGDEDCAQFYGNGSGWNDMPCDYTFYYYVVEYGAPSDLPSPPPMLTFNITTTFPEPETVNVGSCLDLIAVAENSGDNRYNHLILTAPIDCTGEELTPMFEEVDGDLGPLSFRGLLDGQGNTISNLNITDNESNTGLFGFTDGATIRNLNLTGEVTGDDECTGALVGTAMNTTIENVNSSIDVTGTDGAYSVGGLVGCLNSLDGNSAITHSEVSGTLTGYQIGGLVGFVRSGGDYETVDDEYETVGETILADNEFNGEFVTGEWGSEIGGIAGLVYTEYEGSNTAIANNGMNSSINLPSISSLGGLIGHTTVREMGSMEIYSNEMLGDINGYYSVGGVVGNLNIYYGGTMSIRDMDIDALVTGSSSCVGGVVGCSYVSGGSSASFELLRLSFTGEVQGDSSVGGIIGYVESDDIELISIMNSTTAGDARGSYGIGGIAGYAYGTRVTNASSSMSISGSSGSEDIGGLIGGGGEHTVDRSYATGDVVGGTRVGGLIGQNGYESLVTRSYATGDVFGTTRVGGLVGANGEDSIIENSYARGAVGGEDNVGGLVGRCGYATISKSYATGEVIAEADYSGLLGYSNGCEVEDSFWDSTTTGITDGDYGEPRPTVDMKNEETFLEKDWDFSAVWGINTSVNDGYPCLQWSSEFCTGEDSDSDGVPDEMEDAGPNDGDANGDGIPDRLQGNVSSFLNELSGSYVVLETSCTINRLAQIVGESSSVPDASYNYPAGLLNFELECEIGSTQTIKQYFFGNLELEYIVARKFSPTSQSYNTITEAVIAEENIGGSRAITITYQITDGGNLDEDREVNGIIVDPSGPAVLAVGVPNTGLGRQKSGK